MTDILQEKPSQKSTPKPSEQVLPKGITDNPQYREDRNGIYVKTKACEKLVSCTGQSPSEVQERDTFFRFLDANPVETADFCALIPYVPKDKIAEYFDPDEWTSFAKAGNMKKLTDFCMRFDEYKIAQVDKGVAQVDKGVAQVDKGVAQGEEDKEKERDKNKNTFKKLITKLEKDHSNLFAKYGEDLNKFKDNPQSLEFQTAMKGLLSELKSQAKTPESFAEYTLFVEQFHSIGAVSEVDYAVLEREMEELSKGLSSKSAENGGKSSDYKLPEGFHESQNERGVYTKYASVGESFDQVVTIKDGKGSKDIISPKSGYSVHLDNAVNLEEYNFLNQEANLRAKLANVTQTSTEILAKNDDFIAKAEKKESPTPEDTATLNEAKKFKQEKTEELMKQRQEIETALAKLEQEKVQKMPVSGDIKSREEKAHETIQFVDNMGLYALGTENIKVFLDTIRAKAIGLKLDSTQGFNEVEKKFIKTEFLSLIGTDIFNTEPNFTRRADMQDITSVKQKIANNSQGKFDASKVPPITVESLKLLITQSKSTPKNPLV